MIKETNSSVLFTEAQEHLVGGVNSPVRSFKNVGIEPIYFHKGNGPC
ncbi:MAG: aspartate aminotransferase family protein, partial [Candidatus Calescibacterium sp.]|nr:aspartate aminotransferase family protein [Candidatus Calescibacterium sp.]